MREKINNATQTPKRASYWLLVKDGRSGIEFLTTGLLGGRQTLPVFSFEDEAEVFLCLRGSQDGWRVRESTPGELLSMLYTVFRSVREVMLDPIPESSPLDATGLLSVSREDFVGRLESANGTRIRRCSTNTGQCGTSVSRDGAEDMARQG